MKEIVGDYDIVIMNILLENGKLRKENEALRIKNDELQFQLNKYQLPLKNSNNSSIPPSQDSLKSKVERKTKSLRGKSQRSTGGQPGHKGITLTMSNNPDQTTMHSPDFCTNCGKSLLQIEGVQVETRQSIDIPLPIFPITVNHISVEKKCTCGQCNRGTFPSTVKTRVSYGPNIHAAVAYLSTIQHIPFKRIQATMWDFFRVAMSQGTIASILNRMRKQSNEAYQVILEDIKRASCVGADETGVTVNGELHWMWVFQTQLLTYIFHDQSRGKKAIDKHFSEGLPQAVLCTDRHSSYFNMEAKNHQLCLAHLLRNLTYLTELDPKVKWAKQMLEFFRETIHHRKTIPFEQLEKPLLKEKLEQLVNQNLGDVHKEILALQKSLIKHKDYLLNFIEYQDVPYDNNASERAIRPLKVKQKVSGQFKTEEGAKAFCQLYSIVDTARKWKQHPLHALMAVARNC